VKETETVEHSSEKENGDEWVREWGTVMDDFQAEVMFRTEIQPKSDEVCTQTFGIFVGLFSHGQRRGRS
jgi:hypothetical protein